MDYVVGHMFTSLNCKDEWKYSAKFGLYSNLMHFICQIDSMHSRIECNLFFGKHMSSQFEEDSIGKHFSKRYFDAWV